MNSDDGFEELRTQFAEDLAVKIKELQSAVARSDYDVISRISHQIGGSAKSFGYPEISNLAHKLEQSVREIGLEGAADLVKKISEKSVL